MQIRRAQPYAVERQVCVSESFPEMAETPRITGIEIVLSHGQFFGIGIEPVTVSADLVDRHDVADVFAVEIAAVAAVTTGTVFGVKFFALVSELRFDKERLFGGFFGERHWLTGGSWFRSDVGGNGPVANDAAFIPFFMELLVTSPWAVEIFWLPRPCRQVH